jgi:hypothetical protein
VQNELTISDQDSPMRAETSDLSLGGCYIKTPFTMLVGTRVEVSLRLGDEKVLLAGIVVTCYPNIGNGIQFLSMPQSDRDRVRTFLESSKSSDSPELSR